MLIFIAIILTGVPLYFIVLPKRYPPSEETAIQLTQGILPLGGESQ
ncbi:hypothetical protein [Paenibacillus gallinarum]|uniref:Uncharacterized protein n=1 Tax=Paenibacillus gallinarum TaxID=2762232 RepID=A0ABR8SVG6_9BACL|nr:hypothetical protein [Paenibacillus gallinarum]MBD7967475.1 hypothetical protein [Paenibacillus gallinarum]